MKTKIALVFVLLLVFNFATSPTAHADWVPYTSKAGQFSATFPTQPVMTRGQEKTIAGTVAEVIFKSESKDGTFVVEHSTLPGLAAALGGKETILKKSVKAFAKKTGVQELGVSDTTFQGELAKKLSFKTASGTPGEAIFAYSKAAKRLFVISAKSSTAANIQKFLSSVKIL